MIPMDPEIARLMVEHEIDPPSRKATDGHSEDVAEKAQELIDDGLDEDEAVEVAEEL